MNAAERLDWSRDGADWPHRVHSRFVDAGGLRWHVQDFPGPAIANGTGTAYGQAPDTGQPAPLAPAAPAARGPILLLHGTGAASHSWRALAPTLALRARVLAPDLPGHGFTDPARPGEASMAGMARALGALLHSLDATPAWVIGHSAGAAIALRMALDGLIDAGRTPLGVAALNGALLPLHGAAWAWFSPAAKLLAAAPVVPRLVARRAQASPLVDRLLDATGSEADAEGRRLYARLVGSPAHVAGALQMMAHWDLPGLRRELPRLDPALGLHLVVGERDATVPPHQAWQLQALRPATRVSVLPGLGHLAHEEAPQRVLAALDAPADEAAVRGVRAV